MFAMKGEMLWDAEEEGLPHETSVYPEEHTKKEEQELIFIFLK